MCGLFLWGFWWILPLIGFVMCLGFMGFRFLGAGRGFMCMDNRRRTSTDQAAESHR